YSRRIHTYGLATAKGRALTREDKVRGYAIERLMCDLAFSATDIRRRFGSAADAVLDEAERLIAADRDGLVVGTGTGLVVPDRAPPFTRSICARFDAHLNQRAARHTVGV